MEKLNNVLETGFYIPHAKLAEIDSFHAALVNIEKKVFYDPNYGYYGKKLVSFY